MKDAVGLSLREAWREKGNPECIHPELSLERSFSSVTNGAYICTTCGTLIKSVDIRPYVAVKSGSR
jgi:hypothetical protein